MSKRVPWCEPQTCHSCIGWGSLITDCGTHVQQNCWLCCHSRQLPSDGFQYTYFGLNVMQLGHLVFQIDQTTNAIVEADSNDSDEGSDFDPDNIPSYNDTSEGWGSSSECDTSSFNDVDSMSDHQEELWEWQTLKWHWQCFQVTWSSDFDNKLWSWHIEHFGITPSVHFAFAMLILLSSCALDFLNTNGHLLMYLCLWVQLKRAQISQTNSILPTNGNGHRDTKQMPFLMIESYTMVLAMQSDVTVFSSGHALMDLYLWKLSSLNALFAPASHLLSNVLLVFARFSCLSQLQQSPPSSLCSFQPPAPHHPHWRCEFQCPAQACRQNHPRMFVFSV